MFDLRNVDGAIIAYSLPQVADTFCALGGACAQPGFHLHYLNDDLKAGGHLLDCTLESGTLEVTTLRELRLYDPVGGYESLMAP
jgi:acetolactate decarboxylase